MTSSMQSHDWRQQEWVQGRKQMEFRPPQPQQHIPGTVHDVLASAQKGAFSRVDLETLKISAHQLDLNQLGEICGRFNLADSRDWWWMTDKQLIPEIPNCLKSLWAQVLTQAMRLVRNFPSDERAWDLLLAAPFLLLQRWPKCRPGSVAGLNILAARMIRFTMWDIEGLAREAVELHRENRIARLAKEKEKKQGEV
ncbi:MAG TPA: hypothetical protein PLX97_15735, partial [Gemmatales bacterium]|nr:hypothetical protein [Gemmatales bacterium]